LIRPISDPSPFDSSKNLFSRAQMGDQDAWAELFQECYPNVRRVVRRWINGSMRRYVDSTDIANDVFGELVEKAARFHFETIEEVRAFLYEAAYQRVVDEERRRRTKKRDTTRERPMPVGDDPWELSSGEPTPSEIAVGKEEGERISEAAGGETERQVVGLRMSGHNNQEISEVTGWPVRKLQRLVERLRTTFQN